MAKTWFPQHLQVLDALIDAARNAGLLVLLDLHRLRAGSRSQPLWYEPTVPEALVVEAWRRLAARYCESSWNVFGADLFNEPNAASWGGNPKHDWAAAAERIGGAVHGACPRWLLLVEGVSSRAVDGDNAVINQSAFGHNWAGNLEGVRARPLKLPAERLVYSPHVYGPSVAPQDYFERPGFPANMPQIWDTQHGFVRGSAPLLVGEWGGWLSGKDVEWQRAFATYLRTRQIGSFYWALNPTSRDTGGLLLRDWRTPDENKLTLLGCIPGSLVFTAVRNQGGLFKERLH